MKGLSDSVQQRLRDTNVAPIASVRESDPQVFVTEPRPGVQRFYMTTPVTAASENSGKGEVDYIEFATIRFISPGTFPMGGSSLPEKSGFEGWDRSSGRESLQMEDDIPFLDFINSLQESSTYLALDQLVESYRTYGDGVGVDVLQQRLRDSHTDESSRSSEENQNSLDMAHMRMTVPLEGESDTFSTRLVYLFAVMADPYRILVKHPIAVFVCSCLLAFLLSLRRKS